MDYCRILTFIEKMILKSRIMKVFAKTMEV